jgi:hypothetical protein
MTEIRIKIWVFPVIVGALAILSLLTPVASLNIMGGAIANLWMWGLYVYDYGGVVVGAEFISDPMVMIPSLIATSLIVIAGAGSIVSGLLLRKNDNLRKSVIPTALLGILFIVGELVWFLLVPINFPMEAYLGPPPLGGTMDLWSMTYAGSSVSLHTMGFGVIGGFLAGGLAFGVMGTALYYSKL